MLIWYMRILFAVFALLFCPLVPALSVEAPIAVPQSISWSFSVILDPTDSWAKTSVKIDGIQLLEAYSNGTIVSDPFNGQFVLKSFLYDSDPKSTGGLVLYVSHLGVPKGGHVISASSESGSDEETLSAFVALPDDYRKEADTKIAGLEQATKNQLADSNAFWKNLKDMNTSVSSIGRTIADQNRFVKTKFSSLEEWVASLDLNQTRTDAAIALREQSAQKARVSGFVGIASSMAAPVVMGIIVIALLIGALFIVAKVKAGVNLSSAIKFPSGIYPPKDDYGLPVSKEHEEQADALAESGGKWASKKL